MPVSSITANNIASISNTYSNATSSTPAEAQKKFASFLKQSINEVNAAQVQSDIVTEKMALGENVDLHTVMITAQKASITMQATIEIRNKAVEAYQEIMRMQV
ncbi:MAG: flagellar hook-basal body complex protein FliE [Bacillus sp. (in: firmicutes)]